VTCWQVRQRFCFIGITEENCVKGEELVFSPKIDAIPQELTIIYSSRHLR
jgi:hypothetical protein